MPLTLLLLFLQRFVIVMYPPHYLPPKSQLCGGIVFVNVLIVESCKLGLDVIGWPITVLWQLLNEPRPLLSVVIEDLFSISCSQDLMIVYGGTSLRILVGYVSLVADPPLMLMIWLLILWKSYHYLLILILVHLVFCQRYLKFHIKSLGK